jgi:hypothetical protein
MGDKKSLYSCFFLILLLWPFGSALSQTATPTPFALYVEITSPSNGSTFIATANLTFTAYATDPAGVSQVAFYDWGNLFYTVPGAGPTFSFIGMDIAPGLHVLTAIAADNNGITAVSSPATVVVECNNQTSVDFTTGLGLQGWGIFNHSLNFGASSNTLAMTCTGDDPYIIGPDYLCASACLYTQLQVTMQNTTTDDYAQFYFTTMADGAFNEAKHIDFPITPVTTPTNSLFTTYTVDLTGNTNWAGTIKQIRLDPGEYITPDVTPGASNVFNVNSIQLVALPSATCPPAPTLTPVPTATPVPTPLFCSMVDNMEGGSVTNFYGGTWSTYSWVTVGSAAVSAAVNDGTTGANGTNRSLKVTGSNTAGDGTNGFGVLTVFPAAYQNWDANFQGLSFWIKASASVTLRVMLSSPLMTDNDNYGYDFLANTSWTQIQVPRVFLARQGWGTMGNPPTLDQCLSDLLSLNWFVQEANPTGLTLWVDEVCMGTSVEVGSPTPTFTYTKTPSPTPTNSATQTATNTPTNTATNSATNSPTNSASASPTNTPTSTMTGTATYTTTNSTTITPMNSSTKTATPTNTFSPTSTPTLTLTLTPTITQTYSPTQTFSPTPSPSESPTGTPFPPGIKVFPNPVIPGEPPNDKTHFVLPADHGAGKLLIIDLRRRAVRSLDFQAGQDVQWDARDDNGSLVSSGVYIYLLQADGNVSRGTVTVMR